MFLNASLCAALDRIAERAADVRRAFEPGALPERGDVASAGPGSSFTLDGLSVAAPADTYFVLGGERASYTRDGSFSLRGGALTGAGGLEVLGVRAPGEALQPLHVDPVDGALNRSFDPRIEADGTFSYARSTIDPNTGARTVQRVVAGRIAVARFPAGTKLSGGDVLRAPDGVVPYAGSPGDGSFDRLEPMRRARSGVDLDRSLARLKDAYVAFDALQAAENAKGHTGKTAMDLLK